MANTINLAKKYLPLLNEKYQMEAKTSILDGDSTILKEANNVGEINIAKLEMDGLGDFSRSTGYTTGNTSLTWETVKFDKERSQTLKIDRLDNQESMNLVFGNLAGEFLRTKVAPEIDAARIAKIAGTDGIFKTIQDVKTGYDAVEALTRDSIKMDEAEVPAESRILFTTSTFMSPIYNLDSYKSKAILERFSNIIILPQSRMYTGINLNDGTTAYGYTKADGASEINFLIVEKSAVVTGLQQYLKYFSPEMDQDGDSYIFKYRNYNLFGYVFDNKKAGVAVNYKPVA